METTEQEEPDPKRYETEISNILSNGRNFFLPAWIRCHIQNANEPDRWLLGYCCSFLLPVSFILWIVYIAILFV